MAEKYSETFKELYKGYANDAATYSCMMEHYIDCGKYAMAELYKFRAGDCLEYARQFKERYLKWKKIEERA